MAIPFAARPTPQTVTGPSKWPGRYVGKGGKRKYFVATIKKGGNAGKQAHKAFRHYTFVFKPRIKQIAHQKNSFSIMLNAV